VKFREKLNKKKKLKLLQELGYGEKISHRISLSYRRFGKVGNLNKMEEKLTKSQLHPLKQEKNF
jgi:hypothetical protein